MKDCLEEHRDDAEFSSECKEEFEKMMESRAADYRLDSSLREKCADDIEDLCGFQKVLQIYILTMHFSYHALHFATPVTARCLRRHISCK